MNNLGSSYRWESLWVVDDVRVGFAREPFVSGADTFSDAAIEEMGIQNADNGFLMLFSGAPLPGSNY